MMRIFKYELPLHGHVLLPVGARVLSVRDQGETLCLWAEVVPGAPEESRQFKIVPTGGNVPVAGTFIGSFFPQEAQFVFHVYEVK